MQTTSDVVAMQLVAETRDCFCCWRLAALLLTAWGCWLLVLKLLLPPRGWLGAKGTNHCRQGRKRR